MSALPPPLSNSLIPPQLSRIPSLMPTLDSLETAARHFCSLMELNPDETIKRHGEKYPAWQTAAVRIREILAVFETIKAMQPPPPEPPPVPET